MNIMHLALGDAHVKNPNDKNVAEANRRLQLYNKSNVAQKELNDQESKVVFNNLSIKNILKHFSSLR